MLDYSKLCYSVSKNSKSSNNMCTFALDLQGQNEETPFWPWWLEYLFGAEWPMELQNFFVKLIMIKI